MMLRNYHTHTVYCDGKDTPEEMVLAAIEQGFSALGFSGHSPLLETEWSMNEQSFAKYKAEINMLKEKYRDKIKILCGIEQDYYSENSTENLDFVIGSVHCLKVKDGYLPLDDSADILCEGIEKHFGGDAIALAECYYKTLSDVVNKTNACIIGHFDLITKFDDISPTPIFDTDNPQYIKAAKDAIKKLSESGALFEINTGAMTRGLKKAPYPQKELLCFIRECGADVIINSDCHDKNMLSFAFDKALLLAKECGFDRTTYLTSKGICFEKI